MLLHWKSSIFQFFEFLWKLKLFRFFFLNLDNLFGRKVDNIVVSFFLFFEELRNEVIFFSFK